MDMNYMFNRFSIDDSMDVSLIEAFEIALEYCFTFENRNETTFVRVYGLTAYMCTENVAIQTFELIIQP